MRGLRKEDLLQRLQAVEGWIAEAFAATTGAASRGVVRLVNADGIFIDWNEGWTGTEWSTELVFSNWVKGEPYPKLFDGLFLVQLDEDRMLIGSAIDVVLLLTRPSA